MPELPACVRVALWLADAWATGVDTRTALTRALPDIDAVGGDGDRITLWRDLGESGLVVALPRPGDVRAIPGASAEATGAAVEAGECLLAPTLGGMLVPTVSGFGSDGDRGTCLDWTAYDTAPVPRTRLEALDLRDVRRTLTEAVLAATTDLERAGGRPFDAGAVHAARADSAARWALPSSLPGDLLGTLVLAGEVCSAATDGLEGSGDALGSMSYAARTDALRRLTDAANEALADACNLGVAHLAGWVPTR